MIHPNPKEQRMARDEDQDQEQEPKTTFDAIIEAIDRVAEEPDRLISQQLEESLKDAIHATRATGKQASVSIKISVKNERERRIQFAATVDSKLPRSTIPAATLFADDANGLHRSDPAQLRMSFPKSVPAAIPITTSKEK